MRLDVQTSADVPPIAIERAIDLVRAGVIDDRGASLGHFKLEKVGPGERLSWRGESGSTG